MGEGGGGKVGGEGRGVRVVGKDRGGGWVGGKGRGVKGVGKGYGVKG